MSICTQCNNAAVMYQISGHLLCVDCWTKVQHAEALRQQAHQQKMAEISKMQNSLSDMMAWQMGFSTSMPKHEIPKPIHTHVNNPTLNQMNIKDSNIGLLNTGSIENIKSIRVSLANVINSGAVEVADELARISTAVIDSKEIDEQSRDELLQQLQILSEQAATPESGRALGVVRPILIGLVGTLSGFANLAQIWSVSGDIICKHFGVENPFKHS